MRKLKKYLILFLIAAGIPVVMAATFIMAVYAGAFGHVYSKKELKAFQNEVATQVLTQDGELIGKYYSKNRVHVKFDQLPEHLVNALVATEDARYFEHDGVDSRSLLRVLVKSILLGDKSAGGGSTITQQLAKNMYGRESHGWLTMPVNKCKEAILANRLEEIFTKEEILNRYLNTVPFGENLYGIEAAAKRFFNKSVPELKLEEAAVLVGMLKANTRYNPRKNPEDATQRRNVVMKQMVRYDYLSQKKYDSLRTLPITLDYARMEAEGPANYFLVQVRKEAEDLLAGKEKSDGTPYDMEKDGLIIETTLHYDLQQYALAAFSTHLEKMQQQLRRQYRNQPFKQELDELAEAELHRTGQLNRANVLTQQDLFNWSKSSTDSLSVSDSLKNALTMLQAGMVALEPTTGAVLLYVGGIDFTTQPYDQVMARRQLASSFKPIIYAQAIEGGLAPCDYISNQPFELTDYEGWSPENYDHSNGGRYAAWAALAQSKNIPTARLYFETGHESISKTWQALGFRDSLENTPSIALGTASASAYELASAYSAFVNQGISVLPFTVVRIKTADGSVLFEREKAIQRDPAFSDRTAEIMRTVLQRTIDSGTAVAIRSRYDIKMPLAGKTGTSQNFSDAWFTAFNPGIVIVARAGANSPAIHFSSGAHGSGSALALPLVGQTLRSAEQNDEIRHFLMQPFPQLVHTNPADYDCPGFLEDGNVRKFLNLFKKKETTLEDEQKKADRKKNNPLRKLFGK